MKAIIRQIISEGRKIFKKKEYLTISQWAERYRYISSAESSRPGMWDNTLFPFAKEIMDAACDPEVEEVTVMGSAQISKTEILKNIVGYYIDYEPTKILIVMPTELIGRAFSVDKLEPMINNNPCLSNKILKLKGQKNVNTKMHKVYLGGSLTIVGSNSPNSLAQRSVKIVISDDIDRMPESSGEEGDPVRLAEERSESYRLVGFKHIRFSTPTIKGISRIERLYLRSDQREYYVPCPFCNHYQTLKFENLVWDKESQDMFGIKTTDRFENTKYKCEKCGELIEEKHKNWMLNNGKWVAKYPEIKKHRGYWINRLYSQFSSWGDIARRFNEVKDSPEELKVFLNTYLARTWEAEEYKELDEAYLLNRVEDYCTDDNPRIPNGVLFLTAAVDTQPDRLEILVKGWGRDWESWLIHYEKLWGDPDQLDVWNMLDEFWDREWIREDGIRMKIRGAFIDSGGSNTEAVYEYCRRRQYRDIIAIKGIGGWGKPLLLNITRVGKYRDVILQTIGVDAGKEMIYSRLQIEPQKDQPTPKAMHFSSQFATLEYFLGLTAEKQVKEFDRRMGYKIVWKKKKRDARNEPLDLEVYALARAKSYNPDWDVLEQRLFDLQKTSDNEKVMEYQRKKIRVKII
jgi:phage terminase large subunit GpA-like protein